MRDCIVQLDNRIRDAVMYESGRPPLMTPEGTARQQAEPLRSYSDADFAGDLTKRSTSGTVTFLNCGPVMWSSRLQKLTALSSTESEIYAATEAIKDAAYLRNHLFELGVRPEVAVPIHEDNHACITMGLNHLKTYSKARHYVTRLQYIQERIHDGTVKMIPTPTEEQIADCLTKPLGVAKFQQFRDILVHDLKQIHINSNHLI